MGGGGDTRWSKDGESVWFVYSHRPRQRGRQENRSLLRTIWKGTEGRGVVSPRDPRVEECRKGLVRYLGVRRGGMVRGMGPD